MIQIPAASDWAAARGEKWLARLPGMEAMLVPLNEPLIRALQLDAPYRIADIGCGGGGTSFEILRHAPAGSVVHGFDISPVLIEAARSRARREKGNIAFEIADMAIAPPPAKLYDRLVSRLGIMFFDDPATAFANLARWIAPGGRFAFAAWGPLAENSWMTGVRDVVAKIVDVPKTDPEAPGPFRYADPDKFFAVLSRSGFGELKVADWRGPLPVGGGLPAADAANFALGSFSSFGELLAEAGDEALNRARQSLTAVYSRLHPDGTVQMDACVHLFTGSRLTK